jgi:hypothetical protein
MMANRSTASLSRWRREAIQRIAASRRATLAVIAQLPEDEIRRPRTLDRWSVKDMLAHLLTCDEETVRRLSLIARGRGDQIFWFRGMADADRFNARSVARERRTGVPALVRRRKRVTADLLARLRRLPAVSLRDPDHEWTIVQWLPTPGWTHEWDHQREIKAWWRARRRDLKAEAPTSRRA